MAVQSSRISTSLHSSGSKLGELPTGGEYQYYGILRSFGASKHADWPLPEESVGGDIYSETCLRQPPVGQF